jgi:antitoxin component YwqK of YwqJK toxin-antitoxin module
MTVTLLIGQEKIEVDNSLLRNSETVTGLLLDLQQTDVEIIVPSQYLSVIDIYLDFINKIFYNDKEEVVYPNDLLVISDINTLIQCFLMESFFADDTFFVYLMSQAYGMWNEFYQHISSLPDERLVYLYSPYWFVPNKYMNKESFFKDWFKLNANKNIMLNGKNLYHTDVTYHPNGQAMKLKVYQTVNGEKVGYSHEEDWYDNGQLEYRHSYKDGKQDGLWEDWYDNGQPAYRGTYKDGEPDGLLEGWYKNGQPWYRQSYKDGKQDGLWEDWYDDGHLDYRRDYKDGKRDGLWEYWYDNGQPKYKKVYDMGRLISEQNF